jgi:1-pyrroline-5-carboxylate dehydrogenase
VTSLEFGSFDHESVPDLTDASVVTSMRGAIAAQHASAGEALPLRVGADDIAGRRDFASVSPARPDEVVAFHSAATKRELNLAIREATRQFEEWRRVTPIERAALLRALANLLIEDRMRLAALLVVEVGKPWREALGEVTAAADVVRWYARDSLGHAQARPLLAPPGENTAYRYAPLGVGAVISPWNFPIFLMLGMASAAVSVGNTVIIKPSSLAPAAAWHVVRLAERAGIPPGVMTCLTGSGGDVGKWLVTHPATAFVAFTGSRDVGLGIARAAAAVRNGQKHIRRVVLELGGKNAVLVDATADVDVVTREVLNSAFGYSGQKCASASRLVFAGEATQRFLPQLIERADELVVGDPDDPATDVGPLIEPAAVDRVNSAIAGAIDDGSTLVWQSTRSNPDRRLYAMPAFVGDVDRGAGIAQEELFGPVVAIFETKDVDEALGIANSTSYGLTGSIFSNDKAFLETAVRDFHVGNLYVNRGCTGARVGCHPFGGFGLSGTDSKTSGPDYLLNFSQAQSVGIRIGSPVSV